jgi:hypothetical protein
MSKNKPTIFIYSIVRNREQNVITFYKQVREIVKKFSHKYNFLLSIYENDSTDNTKEKIKNLNWSFVEHEIVIENIDTKYFGSTNDEERVKNLAIARNKAIEAKDFLQRSDYILSLEFDMIFNLQSIERIFNFKNKEPDFHVVSSISRNGRHFYDTWGTRRNGSETVGNLLDGWNRKSYDKYYATSNGICMYLSKPFKEGLRYHWFNETLGHHDCEMVVVCDKMHKMGYNNIFILYRAVAIHQG